MKKMNEYFYHIGLKLRIYPSDAQRKIIKINGGASRYIYNKLVADNNEMWKLKKTAHLSPADKDRLDFLESVHSSKSNMVVMIPFLSMSEIDSDMINHSLQNYKNAWNQFKKVKGTSIPTFHKKDYTYSYATSNHYPNGSKGLNNGSIYFIDKSHIRLPKIGKVRFKASKKLIDRIFSLADEIKLGSVSNEMDNLNCCYVSLSLASDMPFYTQYAKTGSICGIDVNLTNFLADSDGNKIESPKFLRKVEAKLKKNQRKLSKREESAKKKGVKYCTVKNYNDQRLKVAKLHKKVANQRSDFHNALANTLVKNHDYIFAEDIKVKNLLKNHKLAKAISDSGWRGFLTKLEWTANKRGKTFMLVNPKNTTQSCSVCGCVSPVKIELGVEEWTCPYCNTHHDRDINAAKNIKNRGMLILGL